MSKTIIITGANGNLGTATVKKFLDEKYRVIAVDRSNSHLDFAGPDPLFELHGVDLTNEKAVESFVEECIAKHGQISGALMLAGGFAMGGIDKTGSEELSNMYSSNFESAYFLSRLLFRHMMGKGYGRLVFIGARPALIPEQGKNTIAYALSKSLLFRLAELLNAEAKNKNIVASVVVPSTIDTAVNRKSMPQANPEDWVTASQLAELLEFICGDKGLPLREGVYKVYNNA